MSIKKWAVMANFALPPTSGGRAFRTFALTALHTASGTASQVLQSLTLGEKD